MLSTAAEFTRGLSGAPSSSRPRRATSGSSPAARSKATARALAAGPGPVRLCAMLSASEKWGYGMPPDFGAWTPGHRINRARLPRDERVARGEGPGKHGIGGRLSAHAPLGEAEPSRPSARGSAERALQDMPDRMPQLSSQLVCRARPRDAAGTSAGQELPVSAPAYPAMVRVKRMVTAAVFGGVAGLVIGMFIHHRGGSPWPAWSSSRASLP